MIIVCPNCRTKYLVADSAIGAGGRSVRCAACKHTWFQSPAAEDARRDIVGAVRTPPEPPAPVAERPTSRAERMPAEPPVREDAGGSAFYRETNEPRRPLRDVTPAEAEERISSFERRPIAGESTRRTSGQRPAGYGKPRAPRRNPAVMWGWAAGGILVVLLAINVFLWRDTLSAEGSPLAGLFGGGPEAAADSNRLLEAAAQRLRIAYPPPPPPRDLGNGRLQQPISGTIENPTSDVILIPPLRGMMLDGDGNVVHSWQFRSSQEEIRPGQSISFATVVEGFPPNARRLRINFDTGMSN